MPGFNLLDVLQGRGYPTDSVVIYLDETVAQRIGKLRKRITEETLSVDDMQIVQDDLAAAVEDAKKSAYTVHGTGRARQVLQDALKTANKKYPISRNFAGQVEPDDDRDEYFNSLLWVAQITKIVNPDGEELVEPTLADVEALRGNAPTWSLNQIETMLAELRDAGADFEYTKQSEDF